MAKPRRSAKPRKPAAPPRTKRQAAGAKPAHVAIVGAGQGGTSLIEIFHNNPLVQIAGVADIDPSAPGMKLAQKLNIPTTRDYRKLLALEPLEVVVDVTGNPEIERQLADFKRPGVAVIEGASAKFMWQLIEARIKTQQEVERHLAEYQSLYHLYVREMQHAIVEERTRIALDIHDGLVQTLVGLNFKLDLCDLQIAENRPTSRTLIQETKSLLKTAIEEARHVVFNLKPIHFDRSELIPALKNFLKTYGRQYGVETEVTATGDETGIGSRTQIFLFRIVQEALSNVQKHSQAKRVRVSVKIEDDSVGLEIVDDGVGFDLAAISADPGKWASFGLKGIIERARLLNGDAVYETAPGKGTTIRIHVPKRDERENDAVQ